MISTNLNGLFNMTQPVWPGMRDAQVRPDHQHLARSTARRASSARPTTRPPRPATSASPRRWRRKVRAAGHHGQRDLPGLYRHRDGPGGARGGAEERRSCRRSRSAAWASPRRSRAASCSWPATMPASSPARPCPPTAASTWPDRSGGRPQPPQVAEQPRRGAGRARRGRAAPPPPPAPARARPRRRLVSSRQRRRSSCWRPGAATATAKRPPPRCAAKSCARTRAAQGPAQAGPATRLPAA